MKSHNAVLTGLVLASLALFVSGCGKDGGTADKGGATAVEVAPAPEAISISADSSGLIFRYVDPATGRAASATTVEGIPTEARAEVVVYNDTAPPPPGWDHVADLRKLPAKTQPRQGFSLKVVRQKRTAEAAKGKAASGGKNVVMFVRNGCGFCTKADRWLTAKKVPFEKINLDHDPKATKRLVKHAKSAGLPQSRLNGVPIIFVGDQAIIGFDKGRLARLLGV